MQGTIKTINLNRGFAFVHASGAQSDYYMHATAMTGGDIFEDLAEGDRVEFDTVPSKTKIGKLEAANVRILS